VQVNKTYHIVQIIDTLDAGGAEKVLITLSNLLFKHQHKVTVITTLSKGIIADQLLEGIELKELKRKHKWHLTSMKQLVSWCKQADVVHVHSAHNLRFLFVAAKIFGLKKKLFFHEHFGNIDIDKRVHWHQKIIFPSVVFIAVSKSLYNWALHNLKLKKENTFLLENIIIKQQFELSSQTKTSTKKLVLVSNFRPPKHIEFAVELMKILPDEFHLTIIGQPANVEYLQSIVMKITNDNLQHKITINHHCSNIQAELHNYDLALHTAKTESGPLVLIEYLAQQLPFITYNTGEVVEQIKPTLGELIVTDFNTSNWVSKIDEILNSDRRQLQNKLASTFEEFYSEDAYYEKCIGIYKQVLDKEE
jgi:glycosyltransferase involved in cell wall biosynthesis